MIKTRLICCTAALLTLACAAPAQDTNRSPADEGHFAHTETVNVLADYQADELMGWTLMVHKSLQNEPELLEDLKMELQCQMWHITRVVPEDKLNSFRTITIWLDRDNHNGNGACFHPNRNWLQNHGEPVEKANSINIYNAHNFIAWSTASQPCILLHELAHAYHHTVLGFNEPRILAAYQALSERGDWEEVMNYSGRNVRHYGLTNHKEMFAELTEAHYGRNDFYPFNRPELRDSQPELAELIETIWNEPAPAAEANAS